ncbi:MAG TPA: hypothetical protein VJA21_01980 [Verrucomicrobiae bacterium]
MKFVWIVFGVLFGISIMCGSAQTDPSSPVLDISPMKLRAELTLDSPQPAAPPVFLSHSADTNLTERDISASNGETPSGLESYNVRSDRFYLIPAAGPVPDNPFERAVDWIGQPEVVHVGKAELSSSVITAVKRKNPLCLLNATVLKMTW